MRAFNIIQSDIDSVANSIKDLESKLASSAYSSKTSSTGSFIRTLIWEAFLSCAVLITFIVYFAYGWTYRTFLIFLLIVSVLFFIFSLISSIKYAKRSAGIAASVVFIVISAADFLSTSLNVLLWFATKDNAFILLMIKDHIQEIEKAFEISIQLFLKSITFSLIASLPAATILFFVSVVKLLKQINKKSRSSRKTAELSKILDKHKNELKALENELERTKSEAQRLFKEETAKQEPDVNVLGQLSALGLKEAEAWLENKQKSDNLNKGRRIYESEIKKDNPDEDMMIKASRLGDPDASLWIAKKIELTYVSNIDSYANAELRDKFKELQYYTKTAESSDNKNLYTVVSSLGELLSISYCNLNKMITSSDLLKTLKTLRSIKSNNLLQGDDLKLLNLCIDKFVACTDNLEELEKKQESEKKYTYQTTYTSTPDYGYTPVSDYKMTNDDKRKYIDAKCPYGWSSSSIETIENDPTLTSSQKEELKSYLRLYD